MNNILQCYQRILNTHISDIFHNIDEINPIILNREVFKVRATFIACAFYVQYEKKETKLPLKSVDFWLRNSFSENNFFSNLWKNMNLEKLDFYFENEFKILNIKDLDIISLYENLLSVEISPNLSSFDIASDKNYRNNLGSYYTPKALAKVVTRKTIDTFFALNFNIPQLSSSLQTIGYEQIKHYLNDLSFVDFSSGAGVFLIEIIQYFESVFNHFQYSSRQKKELFSLVISNIYAFDVDCIALEIAKLNLLTQTQQNILYEKIENNFTHANFLQHIEEDIEKTEKINAFSDGFIYHERLALNSKKLQQYDIILGNPPWEKIRFEEKKFFALYEKQISQSHFKTNRNESINNNSNVALVEFSNTFKNEIEKVKNTLKSNTFFALSSVGELNTYALFTEAAHHLKSLRGITGLILKSGIVSSQVNQKLFNFLLENHQIIAIYDFINKQKIFNIDSRERFCFLQLGKSTSSDVKVSMNLKKIQDIENESFILNIKKEDLRKMNPETGMLPNFSSKEDAAFLLRISTDFPFFKDSYPDVKFGRIVHFTNHAEFIIKTPTDDYLPIYEGKFFNQFDSKFAGFNDVNETEKYSNKASAKPLQNNEIPISRFFIEKQKWKELSKKFDIKFILAWRSLTSATNTRTCIATILPFLPASQSVQFLATNEKDLIYLTTLFNSIVFDFILKKKLNGIDLTQSLINQIPVPKKDKLYKNIIFFEKEAPVSLHLKHLCSSLYQNDHRINSVFTKDALSVDNQSSRKDIIAKIDLLFMFLYGLDEKEIDLILSVFPKQYDSTDKQWFHSELAKLFS